MIKYPSVSVGALMLPSPPQQFVLVMHRKSSKLNDPGIVFVGVFFNLLAFNLILKNP